MAKPIITAEQLRSVLHYDPDTGVFTWIVSRPKIRVGQVAGCLEGRGYRRICIDGRLYYAHRLAWLYVNGYWPSAEVDHKFGVRNDNRIGELREATHAQNCQNRRSARLDNKSGLLGVCNDRGRPVAKITLDYKSMHLGTFDTPEDAHAAYLCAKVDMHPYQTVVNKGQI